MELKPTLHPDVWLRLVPNYQTLMALVDEFICALQVGLLDDDGFLLEFVKEFPILESMIKLLVS